MSSLGRAIISLIILIGGVRIKVTGWVTFSGMEPRLFSQTFLLIREKIRDRESYCIRQDTFGFRHGQDVDVEAQVHLTCLWRVPLLLYYYYY